MGSWLLIFAVWQIWSTFVSANPTIRIWGDVREYPEFFKSIVPYLMDSFGGFLNVEFYLMGHGSYAQAHNCGVRQLKGNYFLAAYYLKCEAEDLRHPETCLCETGIDEEEYRKCVRWEGQNLVKNAYFTYSRYYGTYWGPVIDFGPLGNPTWWIPYKPERPLKEYFDKLCSLYKRKDRPVICLMPLSTCPQSAGPARFACIHDEPDLPSNNGQQECSDPQIAPYEGAKR